jgi:repressor LexA
MTPESVKRMDDLNDVQKRMLKVIQAYISAYGYAPSYREIQRKMGFNTTSVISSHLSILERLGYIRRDPQVARGLHLVRSPKDSIKLSLGSLHTAVEGFLSVPIFGRIVAGKPVPVPASDFNYYDAESTVEIALSMLPDRKDMAEQLYALQFLGDSMVDDMIIDGDIVIMQPRREARDGEMVAVWLADEDETTLKRFYREGDRIRLQPANPTMDPIYITEERNIEVQGVVVMIISQIGN